MDYGYVRVSTKTQVIQRQVENIIRDFPSAQIYSESFTGTKIDRPIFNKLLTIVRKGDTIIFDSVSRMSRNAEEGVQLYFELLDKGINLVFIKEPYINTEVYMEQLKGNDKIKTDDIDLNDTVMNGIREYLKRLAVKQIRIAFEQSEKEVKDLQIRTSEGLKVAKANGKKVGREEGDKLIVKKELENIPKIKELLEKGLKDTEIMKLTGLARNTYYKYKKKIGLVIQ